MNKYTDQWGRYHDKPTDGINSSSNNGWIYTAYAAKAGVSIEKELLLDCFRECTDFKEGYGIVRTPGKELPPLSRDEVLGMAYLGFLKPRHLNGWNFSPYPLPKFSLVKLVKQLSQLVTTKPMSTEGSWSKLFGPFYTRHRNYFWQNNLDQLYRFAFSVPFADRHFLLKQFGTFKFYNPAHLFYAAFGKLQSKFKPDEIDWLKYDEKRGLEGLKKEFPQDHPVRQKLGI